MSSSCPRSDWPARLIVITLLLVAFPLAPAAAMVFKIATLSPDGTPWMEKMRAGAAEIAERTGGRVEFKVYPGGIMGNDDSVMRKIRIGQLHGGVVMTGALADIYPDSQIYSLPFLFRSLAEVDYVRGQMDHRLRSELEQNGFVTFGFAGGGFAYIMCATPLRSVDDIRRQKVWAPAGDIISEAVFEAAGVSPIPLPLSDVLTGLQTGLINTVATSPLGAIALQWHTKVAYVTDVPVSYLYGVLAIDKRAFLKLRPEDRTVVRDVMARVYRDIDRQNRADNDSARQAMQRQGMSFLDVPPDALTEWKDIANRARALLQRKRAFTPAMLETLQQHLSVYRASHPGLP